MDESQIEAIATRAAKTALADFFDTLGVDVTTTEGRKAARDNWNWLTDTRMGSQFIRRTVMGAVIAGVVGAVGWVIVKGLAVAASVASSAVK